MQIIGSIVWRRLDAFGSDACSLARLSGGWRVAGVASFIASGAPVALTYRVDCGSDWRALDAEVSGFWGGAEVAIAIARDGSGLWSLNGVAQEGALDAFDIDLSFTPATNLPAIRRLGLAEGAEASAPAAWLEMPEPRLKVLPQWYRRLSSSEYAYRSPSAGYEAVLKVSEQGFVTRYPGLWEADAVR